MTNTKVNLSQFKENKIINGNNSVTSIIPLMNKSWKSSFVGTEEDCNGLCKRGYFSPNKKFRTVPEIFSTVIDNERGDQMSSAGNIIPPLL